MLNLNALKYLIDTANFKSLAMSAKNNYVSPSAVSQAIKSIETLYEIEIFDHGKNKFEFTKSGQLFIERAKEFLETYQKFNQDISNISTPQKETFHFSTQQSIANIILSKAINDIKENYPNLQLTVSTGTSQRCRNWLESNEISFSLSIDNVPFKANKIPVKKGKFILICSKNDHRSIKEAGIITTEDTAEVIEFKKRYYDKFKNSAPITNQVSSWGLIAKMAIAGLGMAYIPDYIVKSLSKDDYKVKKVNFQTASYTINFYYKKGLILTSYHKELIDHFKNILK